MNNVTFIDNIIKGHAINVMFLPVVMMSDIICINGNYTSDNPQEIFVMIGGCLRTLNIIKRSFENIKIYNSFSDTTTYGLKIIDVDVNFQKLTEITDFDVNYNTFIKINQNYSKLKDFYYFMFFL